MTEQNKAERVLIVDDTLQNIQVLGTVLREQQYQINVAQDGLQALEMVAKVPPDLILLDIMMPGMDGFETCKRLKADEKTREIPIIFLTAKVETEDIVHGFELGAVDYVTKPFNSTELLARVKTHLTMQGMRKELKAYNEQLEQMVAERTAELQVAHRKLQLQVRELDGRDRLGHAQMTLESVDQAYETILEVVRDVLKVSQARIYRPSEDGAQLQVKATLGVAGDGVMQGPDDVAGEPALATSDASPAALTFADGKPRSGQEGEAAVPILYQDEPMGSLWVSGMASDEAESEELRDTLWRLGSEAALLLHAAEVNAELESGDIDVSALLSLDE